MNCFDPWAITPKAFHFSETPAEKEKKKKKKEKREDDDKPEKLAKRLSLEDFSKEFGTRPCGLNSGQVKFLVERFQEQFRIASMPKAGLASTI